MYVRRELAHLYTYSRPHTLGAGALAEHGARACAAALYIMSKLEKCTVTGAVTTVLIRP